MRNINVSLRHPKTTELAIEFAVEALGLPYRNDNSNLQLLKNIALGKDTRHDSVVEHIVFHFIISGISRQCLHHLERHRIASMTVESSRYNSNIDWVFPDVVAGPDNDIGKQVRKILERHFEASELVYEELMALTNNRDIAKYALPEGRSTKLAWTINLRSLLNFLKLRETDKYGKPHMEIKHTAALIRAEAEKVPSVQFLLAGVEL